MNGVLKILNMQLSNRFFICLGIIGISIFSGYSNVVENENSTNKKPHIVLIVADDMGWNDVSFHGANQIPTPNIDALAYNGVILNRHYTLPTCTPSRTSLLTGRYAIREGMQGFPLKAGEPRGIPLNSTLMPEYFRELGYSTHLVGKWHLGYETKDYTPARRGFDTFFGYYNGLITYFEHWTKKTFSGKTVIGHDLHRDDPENLTVAYDSKYFTDLITDEAEKIITNNNDEKPLFLEISHLAVHASENDEPLENRNLTEVNAAFPYIRDMNRRKYAGMLKSMDESIGRVVVALEKAKMLENSIIVFMSDNGAPTVGLYENTGSNYPLRGIKNTLFEGGVRGAACVFSPLIKAASRVMNEPMHITDWLPTLYAAAGGNTNDLQTPVDGLNLWDTIFRGNESPRRSILLNIDSSNMGEAVIIGRYKLVKGSKNEGHDYYGESGNDPSYPLYKIKDVISSPTGVAIKKLRGFTSPSIKKILAIRNKSIVRCMQARTQLNCSHLCLFDIENDPCETVDLSIHRPDIVRKLESLINDYIKVSVPQANKEVDPCSNPKFFNGSCMPWKINYPDDMVSSTTCKHSEYAHLS